MEVSVTLCVLLLLAPRVTLDVGVSEPDALEDTVLVDDAKIVVLCVGDREEVPDGVPDADDVLDAELDGVAETDAVGVLVGDGETEGVDVVVDDDDGESL